MPTSYSGYISGKDIKHWDGVSRTFDRKISTGGTISLNKVGEVVDILEAYGDGTAYTLSTFSTAIDKIGTSNQVGILLQPGDWTITDDQTVPSNIHLIFAPGASMSISSGKTLTINGGVIAGPYEIFSSTGTIAGTPTAIKDSNWANGTVTDSATWAVQIDSVVSFGATLKTDAIAEKTSATGVTVDGVLLKDGEVTTDTINEETGGAGVTIDGTLIKDKAIKVDTISEDTAANGVVIDGFKIKDTAPDPTVWPAFSAHKNGSNQSGIGSGAATKVTFSTEKFDTNSDFDNSSNYRFTPTVAGYYLIIGCVEWTSGVDQTEYVTYINKNGSVENISRSVFADTDDESKTVTAIIQFNGSTDYVELWATQFSGGALTIDGTASKTYFMGSRVA
jgi:hypothetical protein